MRPNYALVSWPQNGLGPWRGTLSSPTKDCTRVGQRRQGTPLFHLSSYEPPRESQPTHRSLVRLYHLPTTSLCTPQLWSNTPTSLLVIPPPWLLCPPCLRLREGASSPALVAAEIVLVATGHPPVASTDLVPAATESTVGVDPPPPPSLEQAVDLNSATDRPFADPPRRRPSYQCPPFHRRLSPMSSLRLPTSTSRHKRAATRAATRDPP